MGDAYTQCMGLSPVQSLQKCKKEKCVFHTWRAVLIYGVDRCQKVFEKMIFIICF